MIKEFINPLTHEDRVRCRIEIMKGKIADFMVQYEISQAGDWNVVVRFDTFHGILHRDLQNPDGTSQKQWLAHTNFDEGLNFSYNHIVENWEKYRDWYFSRLDLK